MTTQSKPSTKPSPLGRGLSALFGDADAGYQPPRTAVALASALKQDHSGPSKMPIEWLQPGSFQPRRIFDAAALEGLAASIKERGILQPILVRPVADRENSYEIIAGERRWRAAQLAGQHEVPVVVRDLADREALEIGLVENVQRQDLSPIEEAEAYQRLMEEFHHTQDGLSKVVGKSRPHISNLLRVLTLPAKIKQLIDAGTLSLGHAKVLMTARDPASLAEQIVAEGLSVRQAEALARDVVEAKGSNSKTAKKQVDADVLSLEKSLAQATGLKVALKTKGNSGSLTLFYKNLEQLDEVIKRLNG